MDRIFYLIAQGSSSFRIGNNALKLPTLAGGSSVVENLFKAAFMISFLLSVIFVALGGFKYTTSAGDPQGVQKAKNTILYSIIGMVVSMSAYAIVEFVIGRL